MNNINSNLTVKDPEAKSVTIKNQLYYNTCWAHSISRTFVRTLQILGVIKAEYNEQFYLVFFVMLLQNYKCSEPGLTFEKIFYLFDKLKDEFKNKIFEYSYFNVKCFNKSIGKLHKDYNNLKKIFNFIDQKITIY